MEVTTASNPSLFYLLDCPFRHSMAGQQNLKYSHTGPGSFHNPPSPGTKCQASALLSLVQCTVKSCTKIRGTQTFPPAIAVHIFRINYVYFGYTQGREMSVFEESKKFYKKKHFLKKNESGCQPPPLSAISLWLSALMDASWWGGGGGGFWDGWEMCL